MVVLMPLFEGEALRSCTKCGHLGLRSTIEERRSFYLQCGHCVGCQHSRYVAGKLKTPSKVRRAAWREEKERQRARDPEGYAERHRLAQAQYRKRHKTRVRQDRQINRTLAKEKNGVPLKTRDEVKSVSGASGVKYVNEPFLAWLWTLVREEQRKDWGFVPADDNVPKEGVLKKVAATLEVPTRRLYAWMNEIEEVDEMTLDRACTHHGGIMPWEIFARFAGVHPPTLAELEMAATAGPVVCRSPGCSDPAVVRYRFRDDEDEPVVVRRWCTMHGDLLEQAREDLEKDVKEFRSRIGRKGARSTCCNPQCRQPRLSTERYCYDCQEAGWREEDYDG